MLLVAEEGTGLLSRQSRVLKHQSKLYRNSSEFLSESLGQVFLNLFAANVVQRIRQVGLYLCSQVGRIEAFDVLVDQCHQA